MQHVQQTHTRTTVQRPLVRDYPGRLALTHSHPSWSSNILYQLPPFTTIHSIFFVQFMWQTVLFDNLSPGTLWSSFWSWTLYFILHAFLHPVTIFFSQHMSIPMQTHAGAYKSNETNLQNMSSRFQDRFQWNSSRLVRCYNQHYSVLADNYQSGLLTPEITVILFNSNSNYHKKYTLSALSWQPDCC